MELKSEPNYFRRLFKPSAKKLKITILLTTIAPFPSYLCYEACDLGFMPLGFISSLVFGPGFLFTLLIFSTYALFVYLVINMFIKEIPTKNEVDSLIISVVLFIIMPLMFVGFMVFDFGENIAPDWGGRLNRLHVENTRDIIKDDFIEIFAKLTKNAQICEKIKYKTSCLISVARKTADISICDKIEIKDAQSKDDKDRCYALIGGDTKDTSICDRITSSYYRNLCQR